MKSSKMEMPKLDSRAQRDDDKETYVSFKKRKLKVQVFGLGQKMKVFR